MVRAIVAVMEYAASKDFQFAPPEVPFQSVAAQDSNGGGSNGGAAGGGGRGGGGGIEDLLSPAFADTVTVTVCPLRSACQT